MHQRVSSVVIMLLALVVTVAGAALANALCPGAGDSPACHAMVEQTHVHRHTTLTSIQQPPGTCTHCISHSNLPPTALEFRPAEMPRPSDHIGESESVIRISYDVLVPRIVNAREHAPPGRSSPLHVQLNVFRI